MRIGSAALMLCLATAALPQSPVQSPWPEVTRTAKPWTRWWWPGSAVDSADLTRQLEAIAANGIGGVEITPIYGARGAEARELEFLSRPWMEMLGHTARESARLDLGVDMATGTGWPFGGPTVSAEDASHSIGIVDGKLTGIPTQMKVKRAAPGGEGLVLDPYSVDALGRYLARFDSAFKRVPVRINTQFHDSFEYYNASWTPRLAAKFREMNGYDLEPFGAQLLGEKPLDADTASRIKGDYRRTLAQLHLDYVKAWVDWSHRHGWLARNQAHGAPANLLDLYALPDIAETESYGYTPLPIPGLRAAAGDVNPDLDPPFNMIGRFAASAAHVAGHPLVSSETLTWLRENFREAPWAAKPQIDRLFAAGINHLFWHGTVYSPADAPWPGWFFYAATQLNPQNPLWRDYGAMNEYVGRVQSVLQSGTPSTDVLLYWPFDDVVDSPDGLMRQLGVHDNAWLTESEFGKLARALIEAGYSVDFISDAQLQDIRVSHGVLHNARSAWQALVVPKTRRMSPGTLKRLELLRRTAGHVAFAGLPEDVPGQGDLEARRAELASILAIGELRAAVTTDVLATLRKFGVMPEPAAAAGLSFVRRGSSAGYDYFFANLGAKAFDGWLDLASSAKGALLLDPLTGRAGAAALRAPGGKPGVYLQLAPGESMILRTTFKASSRSARAAWQYTQPGDGTVALTGPWTVDFLAGGPALPPAARMDRLASWTAFSPAAQSFSGTARYRIEFDAAGDVPGWLLDLGDVRESVRVRVNGADVATAWSLPFRVRLGSLKARGNVLEIEVTNLPANRIRDLDVRKVDWKIMKDINLASLKYQSLDASSWEIAPSGLLGPVRLIPLRRLDPK
jgi:hypothetical protein